MVTLYKANTVVKGGTYLNLKQGEFVTISEEEGILPGKSDVKYVRVPTAAMLVLGPLFGLLFVLFLPLAVPLVLVSMAAKKLTPKKESTIAESEIAQSAAKAEARTSVAVRSGVELGPGKQDLSQIDDLINRLELEISEHRKEKV